MHYGFNVAIRFAGSALSQLIEIYPPFLIPDYVEISDVDASSMVSVGDSTWWIEAHMPRDKVMPGTLIVEGIAQTAVAFMSYRSAVFGFRPHYLISVNASFRASIISSDRTFKVIVKPTYSRRGLTKFTGEACTGDKVCTTVQLEYYSPRTGVSPASLRESSEDKNPK